jgi:hypothetical protein
MGVVMNWLVGTASLVAATAIIMYVLDKVGPHE